MPDLLYGRHAVFHLLSAGRRKVHRVILQEGSEWVEDPLLSLIQSKKIPLERKSQSFFKSYEGLHQGIVAEADPYPYEGIEALRDEETVLLCNGIQDPQNLGSLCRSAYLFGIKGIVIEENRAAPITSVVCKAASGAVEYIKVARISSLPKALNYLKEERFWIYGADSEGEKSLYDHEFSGKIGIVVGAEGRGLSRLVRERVDFLVKIPMAPNKIGSFNASTAGVLIFGEIFRQRGQKSIRTS